MKRALVTRSNRNRFAWPGETAMAARSRLLTLYGNYPTSWEPPVVYRYRNMAGCYIWDFAKTEGPPHLWAAERVLSISPNDTVAYMCKSGDPVAWHLAKAAADLDKRVVFFPRCSPKQQRLDELEYGILAAWPQMEMRPVRLSEWKAKQCLQKWCSEWNVRFLRRRFWETETGVSAIVALADTVEHLYDEVWLATDGCGLLAAFGLGFPGSQLYAVSTGRYGIREGYKGFAEAWQSPYHHLAPAPELPKWLHDTTVMHDAKALEYFVKDWKARAVFINHWGDKRLKSMRSYAGTVVGTKRPPLMDPHLPRAEETSMFQEGPCGS